MTKKQRVPSERASLEETKHRLQAVFQGSRDAIVLVDAETGIILDVNRQTETLVRRSREQLIGAPVTLLHPPELAEQYRQWFAEHIRVEGKEQAFVELMTSDGERIPAELSSTVVELAGGRLVGQGVLRDIRERKNAEQALLAREAKLRSIFRAAPVGIGVVVDRILVEVNLRICEMTGWSAGELVGQSARILYPTEEDYEYVGREKYRQIAERGTGTVETRWRRKDGGIIDVLLSSTPIVPGDSSAGTTFTALDITERKRAEQALREERGLFIAGPVVVIKWKNAEGWPVEYVSPNIATQFGYAPEALIAGKLRYVDIMHPEDLARTSEEVRAHTEAGHAWFEQEYRLAHADGSWRWIRDFTVVVRDGQGAVTHYHGYIRDVTDRKRIEEALQESETRHRSMMEAMDDLVCICSRNYIIEYMNPALIARTGRDAVGEPCYRALHDRQDICPWCVFPRHQERESARWEVTSSKDGRTYHVSNAPIVHADGTISKMAVMRDITDLRRAEEERRALAAQLEYAQKLESLGVLAGGIAHDFNNLLTAILGNLNLASSRLPPASGARGNLDAAEKAAHRAADLCKQMLAYSGKGKFVVEAVNLNDVVTEMVQMLEVSLSKKTALRFNFAPGLPAVEADPGQMHQVVMNLIINAGEAIGDNPGVVAVSTGVRECDRSFLNGTVLGEGRPEGMYVFLEVSDTGCGMDAAAIDRIFDPFFTTKFVGRGLGLAAVLGIVRGHKGAIKVESEKGKGATFTVFFPAAPAAAAASEGAPAAAHPWRGEGMVLLVDDEEMILSIAKPMLEELGFRVITASDGHEAISVFRERRADIRCVLLDLTMPRIDGVATFRELRRLAGDVPVILSSGYSAQEVSERLGEGGIAAFLQKPYSPKGLEEALRAALGEPPGS